MQLRRLWECPCKESGSEKERAVAHLVVPALRHPLLPVLVSWATCGKWAVRPQPRKGCPHTKITLTCVLLC